MRESIGSTWTLQLMFGFILLFVSFLTITISYSKAFKIKNDVTSIIEKYGGFNATSVEIINNYLNNSKYSNTGTCSYTPGDEMLGFKSPIHSSDRGVKVNSGTERYSYCVKKEVAENGTVSNTYYEVTLFYKFNIPIFGDIATFRVKGKTTDMTFVKSDLF